jgi:tetratricopeptide (TPR) repeat protein
LASDDATVREAAVRALSTQPEEALPELAERVLQVSRRRPSRAWALDVFQDIRRAAGSRRADDDVDILPGVLPVLARSRHRRVRRVVEPLLLWRSLEGIGTTPAIVALAPLMAMDEGVWFQEARRMGRRLGAAALPAAIRLRRDSRREVRRWADEVMERHRAEEPGRAVQGLEPTLLAEVLAAYAAVRTQRAMPVIAGFVGHPRRSTRRAARSALETYGAQAIWVLRTAYHHATGEHAPREWSHRRLREALFAHHDARRLAPARQALEEALAAAAAERWPAFDEAIRQLLARSPEPGDTDALTEALLTRGRHALEAGALEEAERSFARAERLSPGVAAGLLRRVDEARTPYAEDAVRPADEASPEVAAPPSWPAILLALGFLILGLGLLRGGSEAGPPPIDPLDDATLEGDDTVPDGVLGA